MYGQTWEGTRQIGHYLLLDIVGEGGMAIVWEARDLTTQQKVAFKMLKTGILPARDFDIIRRRFAREIKTLSFLQHPAIVPILDYGEEEGIPYLVMPFLQGGTLSQHIEQGPLPWREAVRLLIPIADALAYAHEQGIIHRDVKPSNILLDEQGQPLLSDFGVARLLNPEATTQLTTTGVSLGTPAYMAPEQALGKSIDGRADVYSLACVLYELITGEPPYTADTPMGILLQHLQAPPPPLTGKAPQAPKGLERLLTKALAKDPKDRPTMATFRQALETLLAKDTRRSAILWPPPGQRRVWLIAALLALAGLGAGIAFPRVWGKETPTPTPVLNAYAGAENVLSTHPSGATLSTSPSPTPTPPLGRVTPSPTAARLPSPTPHLIVIPPTPTSPNKPPPTPSPTATATPTLRPSPTPTTPSPTPPPSPTPTPSPTATATGTATPTPPPSPPPPSPTPTPTATPTKGGGGGSKTPTPTPTP